MPGAAITHHTLYVTRPDSAPRPPDAVAYALFRHFSDAAVAAGHPRPEIRRESDLVADLHEALDRALAAVRRKRDRHDDFDYMLGYGTGHVLGQLQVQWRNDYLLPHDRRYKAKVVLDALLGLARLDDVLAARLQALYAAHFRVDGDAPGHGGDGPRLANASTSLGAYVPPTVPELALPPTDRWEGALERVRTDLIVASVRGREGGREVRVEDVGGELADFVATWLTYAVSGIVMVDAPPERRV